jgi:hypothetical protein
MFLQCALMNYEMSFPKLFYFNFRNHSNIPNIKPMKYNIPTPLAMFILNPCS